MKKTTNTEEFVYNKIKTAIVKRYIKQGTQLLETSLAEQIGVSRTPVRGAIKRLSYEGVVNFISNRGAFVIEPTEKDIRQAFAVRIQLEKMAAGQAAENISAARIKELVKLLEAEKKIFDQRDLDQYYEFNDNFHFLIAKAAENKILLKYVKEIVNQTTIYLILFDPFFQMKFNPSIGKHSRIVNALEGKNSKEAEKAMENHLKSALKGMTITKSIPEDYLAL